MRAHPALRAVVAGLGLLVAGAVPPAAAHDMAVTRATATIAADGRYCIEVVVDPEALAAQLLIERGDVGVAMSDPTTPAAVIGSRIGAIGRRIDVVFDGHRVVPHIDYPDIAAPCGAPGGAGATPGTGSLRLSGSAPPHARTFAFSYGWAFGSVALTVRQGEAASSPLWLARAERSHDVEIGARPQGEPWWRVMQEYFALGFTHIVPHGLDHVLFVLGLFFLAAGWRSLLVQVSAFTLAHTITLGLSTAGVIGLPASVVEPIIALSIVYVAVENLVARGLSPSRVGLVFAFGLLHGLGFAGVLADAGVSPGQRLTALLAFNLGVEAGQLTVLGLAAVAVAKWRAHDGSLRPWLVRTASVTIALVGLYWVVVRTLTG